MKQETAYHAYIPFDEIIPSSFIAIDFETATVSRMACQMGIVIVENGIITDKKTFLFSHRTINMIFKISLYIISRQI